jgi:hypothetical protein
MSKFDARSFIQRDSLLINNLKIIQLIFLSNKIEGILLYNRIDSTNFIGIKIENSYVHFVFILNGIYENLMLELFFFLYFLLN